MAEPRERGIFTEADRAYLAGEREYDNPQSEWERNKAIRSRFRNALLDFSFLLETQDKQGLKDLLAGEDGPTMDPDLREGVIDTLAVLLYGTDIEPSDHVTTIEAPGGVMPSESTGEARELLSEAIRRAHWEGNYAVGGVSLEFDHDPVHVDRIRDRLDSGEPLNPAELAALQHMEGVDLGAVTDAIRDQLDDVAFDREGNDGRA